MSKHIIYFLLTCALIALVSCTAPKMSIKEAKEVTVSMSGDSFVPPPRRIDDILNFLNHSPAIRSEYLEKLKSSADKLPPQATNDSTLANFYLHRGIIALKLLRGLQALNDFRIALSYAEKAGMNDAFFRNRLGLTERRIGNFKRAIELLEGSLDSKYSTSYSYLVETYVMVGDLDKAIKLKEKGVSRFSHKKGPWSKISAAKMKGEVFEALGDFEKAEKQFRYMQDLGILVAGQWPNFPMHIRQRLAQNLRKQGRLIEAESECRQTLRGYIALYGKNSLVTGDATRALAVVLHEQGRLHDAEKLLRVGIRILEDSGIVSDSSIVANARVSLGNVLSDQHKYSMAMSEYDLARKELVKNKYYFNRVVVRNPNFLLCMIKTDRISEAMELLNRAYDINRNCFGDNHYLTAEVLALQGLANAKMNRLSQALKDYMAAIPILLENNIAKGANFSKKQLFIILVESYIDLLGKIHNSILEKEMRIKASFDAFMLADAIRGHSVQGALGASSARMAVANPELSDLARKEQDAKQQMLALESIISEALAAPEDQRDRKSIQNLMYKHDALNNARKALLAEIEKKFPRYSNFTNPPPATVSTSQKYIQPGEALISIYSTENHTYVWAIDYDGTLKFHMVNVAKNKINRTITQLRKAVDATPMKLRDIPEFDIGLAHALYKDLLEPVKEVWEKATELIIVAQGPLSHLPFSILPITASQPIEDKNELFGRYRKVQWLIRKVAITRQPSVSSMITLRMIPESDKGRKAFVGFGDPFFNRDQLSMAEKDGSAQEVQFANHGGQLQVRGLRITETGSLDSKKITSSNLDLLNRLPDTAEEIKSIADTLGADPSKDIFLGLQASEQQVKAIDLSDRRVIAFATHALVPGDLDGLNQPALALSSPSITGENEDGLLTMGEIFKLRLNADWVVLSACNTAAASGEGAEVVSGLGRAFFYAGTKAILVSMWPVETTSALKLTTGLFRFQQKSQKLSRAKALRKAMLKVIDSSGLKDETTGKIAASYAHPLFWAPFITVGDSGNRK